MRTMKILSERIRDARSCRDVCSRIDRIFDELRDSRAIAIFRVVFSLSFNPSIVLLSRLPPPPPPANQFEAVIRDSRSFILRLIMSNCTYLCMFAASKIPIDSRPTLSDCPRFSACLANDHACQLRDVESSINMHSSRYNPYDLTPAI